MPPLPVIGIGYLEVTGPAHVFPPQEAGVGLEEVEVLGRKETAQPSVQVLMLRDRYQM